MTNQHTDDFVTGPRTANGAPIVSRPYVDPEELSIAPASIGGIPVTTFPKKDPQAKRAKPCVSADVGPGLKFDDRAEKLDWDLLPTHALEEVIRVMQFGQKKYGRDNWQALDNFDRRYFNAALRHIVKERKDGEIRDEESNLLSLAHAACCVLFRLEKECAKHNGCGDIGRFKEEEQK